MLRQYEKVLESGKEQASLAPPVPFGYKDNSWLFGSFTMTWYWHNLAKLYCFIISC